jgi:uncharacterized Tic20 family protein
MTREPAPEWAAEPALARDADATWAMLSYLGAIFLGPLIPLAVFAVRRRKSEFMRYHGARALNLSLTVLLYVVCCAILGAMLALDSVTLALAVALPLVFLLWLAMLKYLIRGVIAAQRGEPYEVPSWICATVASESSTEPALRHQRPDHRIREQPATLSEEQSAVAHVHQSVQSPDA